MNRYREARIKAGLSQKAAAISLGVKSPSMSDWESGKSKPTHTHLVAMAALYNTTTDYLTGASDTEKKHPPHKAMGWLMISFPAFGIFQIRSWIRWPRFSPVSQPVEK